MIVHCLLMTAPYFESKLGHKIYQRTSLGCLPHLQSIILRKGIWGIWKLPLKPSLLPLLKAPPPLTEENLSPDPTGQLRVPIWIEFV